MILNLIKHNLKQPKIIILRKIIRILKKKIIKVNIKKQKK